MCCVSVTQNFVSLAGMDQVGAWKWSHFTECSSNCNGGEQIRHCNWGPVYYGQFLTHPGPPKTAPQCVGRRARECRPAPCEGTYVQRLCSDTTCGSAERFPCFRSLDSGHVLACSQIIVTTCWPPTRVPLWKLLYPTVAPPVASKASVSCTNATMARGLDCVTNKLSPMRFSASVMTSGEATPRLERAVALTGGTDRGCGSQYSSQS